LKNDFCLKAQNEGSKLVFFLFFTAIGKALSLSRLEKQFTQECVIVISEPIRIFESPLKPLGTINDTYLPLCADVEFLCECVSTKISKERGMGDNPHFNAFLHGLKVHLNKNNACF
jgi:hypothetical protein